MKTKIGYTLLTILFLISAISSIKAQQKETAAEYLARLRNTVDSIKKAKQEGKNNPAKTATNLPARYASNKYSTNKATIENTYKQLTAAEKKK